MNTPQNPAPEQTHEHTPVPTSAPITAAAPVHPVHSVHKVHNPPSPPSPPSALSASSASLPSFPSLPSLPSLASLKNLLFSYQWDWLTDPAQFKIGLWARQTGKDYTCAAEAVIDSINTPNNHWLIIACGERQAIESLQHAKFWAELVEAEFSYSKTEIRFSNGSRITALPAKPETIRGYSANLILTEFAFHDQPEQIWRAVFPILTNPLKAGPRKLRIISTPNGHSNLFHKLWTSDGSTAPFNPNLFPSPSAPSAPSAINSLSPQLITDPLITDHSPLSAPSALKSEIRNHTSEIALPNSVQTSSPSQLSTLNAQLPTLFSRHKITIHDAVAHGLPINIPLLQRGLADTEAFTQEYLCEFLDRTSVLLPFDLIATCESPDAIESSTPQLLSTHTGELFLGIDFARKHDLTVAWTLERVPLNPNLNLSSPSVSSVPLVVKNQFLTREVLILPNTPTPAQLEHLTPRIHRARRVCLDYTGAGIGLGDLLVQSHGEYQRGPTPTSPPARSGKIELCTFTAPLKHELFSHLRSAFERQLIAIPGSTAIREDLHSIQRVVTANGQIHYRAAHTPDGHSDRATALALALRAAESAPQLSAPSSVGPRNSFLAPRRFNRF